MQIFTNLRVFIQNDILYNNSLFWIVLGDFRIIKLGFYTKVFNSSVFGLSMNIILKCQDRAFRIRQVRLCPIIMNLSDRT